jgi:hypothetical protein
MNVAHPPFGPVAADTASTVSIYEAYVAQISHFPCLPAPFENWPLCTAIRLFLRLENIAHCRIPDENFTNLDARVTIVSQGEMGVSPLLIPWGPPFSRKLMACNDLIYVQTHHVCTRMPEGFSLCRVVHVPPLPFSTVFIIASRNFVSLPRNAPVHNLAMPMGRPAVRKLDLRHMMGELKLPVTSTPLQPWSVPFEAVAAEIISFQIKDNKQLSSYYGAVELDYAQSCVLKRMRGIRGLLASRGGFPLYNPPDNEKVQALLCKIHERATAKPSAAVPEISPKQILAWAHAGRGVCDNIALRLAMARLFALALKTCGLLDAVIASVDVNLVRLAPFHAGGPFSERPLAAFVPHGVTLVLADQGLKRWITLCELWAQLHPGCSFVLVGPACSRSLPLFKWGKCSYQQVGYGYDISGAVHLMCQASRSSKYNTGTLESLYLEDVPMTPTEDMDTQEELSLKRGWQALF